MARVQGMKEKLHAPLYDAFRVQKNESFADSMKQDRRMLRFFVDVQGKTKLETNLQASGVLPSHNTFEARALRVVASTPPGKDAKPSQDADTFLSGLIYNSVTSFIVGEKVMIEMPTFWFPSGSGVFSGNGAGVGHGQPNPMATFRLAEPVTIEPHQNFRVEMLFPHEPPADVSGAKGELRIWVVVDGYLTRDVQ
jgi:hypothetical protein